MGVKVINSFWNTKEQKEEIVEYTYDEATTWGINQQGQTTYLEIIKEEDGEDPRVVAMFNGFDRVEVIDED